MKNSAEIHSPNSRQVILRRSKGDDKMLGKCCAHGTDDTLNGQH